MKSMKLLLRGNIHRQIGLFGPDSLRCYKCTDGKKVGFLFKTGHNLGDGFKEV